MITEGCTHGELSTVLSETCSSRAAQNPPLCHWAGRLKLVRCSLLIERVPRRAKRTKESISVTDDTPATRMLVLGIEGSANKVGVGIVSEDGTILANPRHT